MVHEEDAEFLRLALRSRNSATQQAALSTAASQGLDGEHALLEALSEATGWTRGLFVAALGDVRRAGPADAVLRAVLEVRGPGTRDLRCAALISLAKRLGSAATPEFISGLGQSDTGVRGYAAICLAAFGDARAWEAVTEYLGSHRRPKRDADSQDVLTYLLRHVHTQDVTATVELIRDRWPVLEREQVSAPFVLEAECVTEWVARVWPGVEPGGPPRPEIPSDLEVRLGSPEGAPLFSASS